MTCNKMGSVEKWRKFFEGAGADICSVIEYAILVAVSDCPNEFRSRRDKIAERLYTSKFLRCCECDAAVTLSQPSADLIDNGENDDDDIKGCHDKYNDNDKVTSSSDDADRNRVSIYSYDEAEALTEEIEEESEVVREVFRIKDIITNPEESDSQLYESLRRLELMQLCVETLRVTDIGRQVHALKKHNSKIIRSMAKMLISNWKDLVDEWLKLSNDVAETAITGTSSDSVSAATVDDENGLPSPPLEEGAFLATQTTSIEISQFFDGMDDDGNPHISEKTENNDYEEDEKQYKVQEHPQRKQPAYECNLMKQETAREKRKSGELRRNAQTQAGSDCQGNLMSSANHMITSSGPGRPPIPRQERNIDRLQQKSDFKKNQKQSPPDDASVKLKFEAAKRKLQERYQQEEKAKKQRTVQVMEIEDLPKQGSNHIRQFNGKPGPHHQRQWINNRR